MSQFPLYQLDNRAISKGSDSSVKIVKRFVLVLFALSEFHAVYCHVPLCLDISWVAFCSKITNGFDDSSELDIEISNNSAKF